MGRINWNEPRFGKDEIEEVKKVLEEAYVNEGPRTRQLEELIKDYLGVKHVILTTSATAALYLAVKADAMLRNVREFEVIVPDMTMIATATSVGWAGGKPVLVDVDKDRMTINAGKIEEKITPQTIAIMPVHTIGRACDMEKIREIARKHNLTIIEDAAGALGSKDLNGKFLGTIGEIGCYSLQSNKLVTCGQGGVIVSNRDKHIELIKRLRDFGRLSNKEFLHEMEGYNLKFNDLLAALTLVQFKKIEEKKDFYLGQFELYKKELEGFSDLKFPEIRKGEIPLWVDVFAKDREGLIEYLKSFEIYPRECWPSVHRNKPYSYQGTSKDFPNSSFISDNVLWLPNGLAISDEQIKFICVKIKEFYGGRNVL